VCPAEELLQVRSFVDARKIRPVIVVHGTDCDFSHWGTADFRCRPSTIRVSNVLNEEKKQIIPAKPASQSDEVITDLSAISSLLFWRIFRSDASLDPSASLKRLLV
jgi:hypothetical protein